MVEEKEVEKELTHNINPEELENVEDAVAIVHDTTVHSIHPIEVLPALQNAYDTVQTLNELTHANQGQYQQTIEKVQYELQHVEKNDL
eukprot:UN03615